MTTLLFYSGFPFPPIFIYGKYRMGTFTPRMFKVFPSISETFTATFVYLAWWQLCHYNVDETKQWWFMPFLKHFRGFIKSKPAHKWEETHWYCVRGSGPAQSTPFYLSRKSMDQECRETGGKAGNKRMSEDEKNTRAQNFTDHNCRGSFGYYDEACKCYN